MDETSEVTKSRQWIPIKQTKPGESISEDHQRLEQHEIPTPKEGEVLIKNLQCSVDPSNRIRITNQQDFLPVTLGQPMLAITVGVVIKNNSSPFVEGTFVTTFTTMSDQVIGTPNVNTHIIDNKYPLTSYLSIFGLVIGMTAYSGIHYILNVTDKDVVVISAGAGAVGSIAGQLAKIKNATVIGLCGSNDKVNYLKKIGYDYAINYKTDNISEMLKKIAPDGVTCQFDNVGGDITDIVLEHMSENSRLALCGQLSGQNDENSTIKNWKYILYRKIMVKGFLCLDYGDKLAECVEYLKKYVDEGRMQQKEDIEEGFERFPEVVNKLFNGTNTGKLILKMNDY